MFNSSNIYWFEKAFDTIDHDILIKKLEYMGIKQKLKKIHLVWKTGYLEHTVELPKSLYVLPFYDLIKYQIAISMY